MKLVFFDIECASVHKYSAKICAFGYVVCDEQFNIIEKTDLLINPKGRFELTDRRGERGIVLPYDEEEFKTHPPFYAEYRKIKNLLEDKDALVFGHAVLNDVKYLNLETRRFKLPSFRFSFADSQLLYMSYKNDFSHQAGLESAVHDLGVEFTPHRAADDAYATMCVVKALCEAMDCDVRSLLKIMRFNLGKIEGYKIIPPQSGKQREYAAEQRSKKEARSRARMKFHKNVDRRNAEKRRKKFTGRLDGVKVNFARAIEDDISVSLPLVNELYRHGGTYERAVEDCDVFVRAEGDDARLSAARSAQKQVLTVEEFGEYLND